MKGRGKWKGKGEEKMEKESERKGDRGVNGRGKKSERRGKERVK